MILQLDLKPVPQWLKSIKNGDPFPLRDVLSESLYYPASGTDGKPVKYMGGHAHSFIYTDYTIDEDAFKKELSGNKGFKGYHVVMQRKIERDELYPKGHKSLRLRDGESNPKHHQDKIKPFFAYWAILERDDCLGDNHGPHRFSMLFLCDESVFAFYNLYRCNHCFPECVTIIQPSGVNWTDFRNPEGPLARQVLTNPAGQPHYLLYGGTAANYDESPWPNEYRTIIAKWSNNSDGLYSDQGNNTHYNFVLWNNLKK